PVRVQLQLPSELNTVQVCTLTAADGQVITAQLTGPRLFSMASSTKMATKTAVGTEIRELCFVVPSLKAGQELKLTGTIGSGVTASAGGYQWNDTKGDNAELRYDNRPVMKYMYHALDPNDREDTYKPYHHVYDPAGTQLLTKGPGGLFTHHRGLFFG